ncbi:hypothetical protein PT008_04100 [Proteus mirabilis]|nr:hypothetical protein [Proteus mirabilis]WFC29426.1 hypothetical protein PT008_04100 [Proteus mirabilis]
MLKRLNFILIYSVLSLISITTSVYASPLERGQTNFTIEIILYLLNELDKTIFDLVAEVFYEDPGEILTEYQRQQQFNTELTLIN